MTLTCPICETPNDRLELGQRAGRCRQCATDLGPLLRISEMPLRYHQEGMRLLGQGELQAAVDRLAVAASLEPGRVDSLIALARAYAGLGAGPLASACLERATRLAPDHPGLTERWDAESQTTAGPIAADPPRSRRPGWAAVGAAALLGVVAGVAALTLPPWTAPRGDAADAIRGELRRSPELRGLALRVERDGETVRIAGEVPSALHRELVGALAARGAQARADLTAVTVAPTPPASATSYRIRRGDTLWRIARRAYGNPGLWPQIAAANQELLDRSRALRVGDRLALPTVTVTPR
jgi:phage tail protein X